MREIKFRAWHGESSEMVYFDNRKLTQDEYQRCHLAMLLAGDYGDVLMQFTGLQDKNGVDIYEGDIVLLSGHTKTKVSFFSGCFYTVTSGGNYRLGGWDANAVEVIGNIYENKELLDSTNKEG